MLNPKTIRTGTNLGTIDVAIRRPDYRAYPSELTSVHIEGSDAVISTGVIGAWNTFAELYRIPRVSHAAIAYDGSWATFTDADYNEVSTFYTIGEPYIAYVRDNTLFIQQGNTSPTQLHTGTFTDISCIRGWQNMKAPEQDQGLVVAYIENGSPYFQNYSPNDMGKYEWSRPQEIPTEQQIKHIRVFRSNDYRVLFALTTVDNEGILYFTERCFSGLSTKTEQVSATVSLDSVGYATIKTVPVSTDRETVTATVGITCLGATARTSLEYFLGEIKSNTLYLYTDIVLAWESLYVLRRDLRLTDARGHELFIQEVTRHRDHIACKLEPLTDVVGDITVSYDTAGGGLCNLSGMSLDSFSYTITPQGADNILSSTVKLIDITNTGDKCLDITFDAPVVGDLDLLMDAFEIVGVEEDYVHGPRFTRTYHYEKITQVTPQQLRFSFTQAENFNNVQGNITLKYHARLGNLKDSMGARVFAQQIEFLPVGLEFKPNPHERATVHAEINIDAVTYQFVDSVPHSAESECVTATASMDAVVVVPVGTIIP